MNKWIFIIVIGLTGFVYFMMSGPSDEESVEVTTTTTSPSKTPIKEIVPKKIETPQSLAQPESLPEKERFEEPLQERPEEREELVQDLKSAELSDAEVQDLEEHFARIDEDWDAEMENLLIAELGLPPDSVQEYERIRAEFDEERGQAYKQFHESGKGSFAGADEEMDALDEKILKTYQEKMKGLLGDEGFFRYQEILENFNDKIETEQDPRKGIMRIEF